MGTATVLLPYCYRRHCCMQMSPLRSFQIDWDYHMRLLTAGTPGQDALLGSIVHFHHFRHWRAHGVSHLGTGEAMG